MRFYLLLLTFLLFLPTLLFAADIKLPANLQSEAVIIRGERERMWEKTLVVKFPERRRTLSTYDGLVEAMAAMNHSANPLLWGKVNDSFMGKDGRSGKTYTEFIHEKTAKSLNLNTSDITKMATAADMDNLAVVTKEFGPLTVTALVTAGAKGNAIRTGVDEGNHIEGQEPHGTINIMLLTNARLTDGAMARAIVTVTEAKTAALQDLNVSSTYTKNAQATGTGTDSVIIVSGTTGPKATYAGGHSKLGELIGKATHEAVIEALGKQNGYLLPGAKPYVTETTRREKTVADAALKWLGTVDEGRLGDSWREASEVFRQSLKREAWEAMAGATRAPLGRRLSRQLHRSVYTKYLPGAPEGEYLVMEFITEFEKRADAIETLTSRLDQDGVWRVSGYFVK
jgi:adenosylcobinamide amidohydrolase